MSTIKQNNINVIKIKEAKKIIIAIIIVEEINLARDKINKVAVIEVALIKLIIQAERAKIVQEERFINKIDPTRVIIEVILINIVELIKIDWK
jgi:hypothetical protein